MSNLTLLSRFQRVDACNAAICIQIYDLLMSRRGTDRQQDKERASKSDRDRDRDSEREGVVWTGVTRNIRQRSIRQRGEKHQNRAINYIIVHRVSGAGHSHDGLPVERDLDKG